MLTSKEIIERTGISRATLNNYIAAGLIARPEVLPPGPEHGAAPRIGYFPDDTIERVRTIQRLKREGWAMGRIAERLAAGAMEQGASAASARAPVAHTAPTNVGGSARKDPGPGAHVAASAGTPRTIAPPALVSLAIVVATLQDANGLWGRLAAQEYFELANEIWSGHETIFRRHRGILGRHPGEGLVGYFMREPAEAHLGNALATARDVKDAMRALSRRWQARKEWDLELAMNLGIDEGEEWMGAIGADEHRVLGDAAERAEQLSRCGRPGSVLATRGFIGKLPADMRSRIEFAAPGIEPARGKPLLHTFAPLSSICASVSPRLGGVAVAEILLPASAA